MIILYVYTFIHILHYNYYFNLLTASPSSNSSYVYRILVVIFTVIAVIAVVAAAVLIVIIAKRKVNSSAQQMPPAAPVYETIDELPLSENELKNPTYSTRHEISHNKHPITSTDELLYEPVSSPNHSTNDIELQQNPAYGTSDKVIMDGNPAYRPLK